MGALLCLLSAACFGAMAIFGKYAYDARVDVADLLLLRFVIAAVLLLVVARATGALRNLPRRSIAGALAMGGIGYATQAGLFFGALERMDASLLALILYAYPTLVMLGAIALGRERASVRRVVALLVASAGTVLVLGAAAAGGLDALGTAMGFGAAIAYTVYILVGDRLGPAIPPLALAALVCTGAAGTFAVVSAVRGGPNLDFDAAGWGWVSAIAVVSTVAAIVLFFAGVARVGPSTASILSTLEPVVTVALAALVFHDSLGAVQLAGGALVLSAAVIIQPIKDPRGPRRGPSAVGGGEQFGDAAAGGFGAQGFAAGVEAAAYDAGVVAEQQESPAEQGERGLAVFAEVSLEATSEGDQAVVPDADRCRQ
ncbi:DMT family transporter [Kribbella voronezhensis]|uniref:DMT family transporter n=1 Tax=Kribbella voronezhensis TaxID=2512212 RepID=UPI001EDE7527|nr:DMT family transporter [Kribbella voronezhensis]